MKLVTVEKKLSNYVECNYIRLFLCKEIKISAKLLCKCSLMAGRIRDILRSTRRQIKTSPKRRLSLKQKIVLGVGLTGATAATFSGIQAYKAIAVERQKVAVIREQLETRIPNPGPWTKLCRIYNFDPRSEQVISVIKIVNGLAQKYKTSPERIWLTLEKNIANKTEEGIEAQLTALNNAIARARSEEDKKKIGKVKSVVLDVALLKDRTAKKIILDAVSTEGSHDALKAEFGFSD